MLKRRVRLYLKIYCGIIVLALIGVIYSIYSKNLFSSILTIVLVISSLFLVKKLNEILQQVIKEEEKLSNKKVI